MNGLECSNQLRSADALEDVALGTGGQCSGDAHHIIERRQHHELATGAIFGNTEHGFDATLRYADVDEQEIGGGLPKRALCVRGRCSTRQSASERAMAWNSTRNACCHNFLHQGKGCRPRRISAVREMVAMPAIPPWATAPFRRELPLHRKSTATAQRCGAHTFPLQDGLRRSFRAGGGAKLRRALRIRAQSRMPLQRDPSDSEGRLSDGRERARPNARRLRPFCCEPLRTRPRRLKR